MGGTAHGSWLTYVRGGSRRTVVLRHGVLDPDPRPDVPLLTGSTLGTATLTAGADESATAVATAIEAAVTGLGDPVSRVGDIVTIDDVESAELGPATVAGGARGVGGIHHFRSTASGVAPISGTLCRHIIPPNVSPGQRGRVIGLFSYGISGFNPRMAIGRGPAHPGAVPTLLNLTDVVDAGRVGPIPGPRAGCVELPTYFYFTGPEDLWIMTRDNATGGSIPLGSWGGGGIQDALYGDFSFGESLLSDTAIVDPNLAYPSNFSPTVDFSANVFELVGMIYELEPFGADASLYVLWGQQYGGLESSGNVAALANETTSFRMVEALFRRATIDRIWLASGTFTPGEDWGFGAFSFGDLVIPGVANAPRLRNISGIGLNASDTLYEYALPTPLQIGSETIGTGRIPAVTFNGGQIGGGVPTTQIRFSTMAGFLPVAGEYWDTPDRTWSDWEESSGQTEIEYRTLNAGTMPQNNPNPAVTPDPFIFGATDDSPPNHVHCRVELTSPGLQFV